MALACSCQFCKVCLMDWGTRKCKLELEPVNLGPTVWCCSVHITSIAGTTVKHLRRPRRPRTLAQLILAQRTISLYIQPPLRMLQSHWILFRW